MSKEMKKSFAIELTEETVNKIKAYNGFKSDGQVRKMLQVWVIKMLPFMLGEKK